MIIDESIFEKDLIFIDNLFFIIINLLKLI
jgi:hypothetical protein